jgi:tol-pal system protein YbgF
MVLFAICTSQQENKMSKKISAIGIAITTFVLATTAIFAQEDVEYRPTFGLGFNGGVQKIYCDVPHTGMALTGEGFMRFMISDRFHLQLGLGYGQLSDGFSQRTFHTNVFNADLKGNIYLSKKGFFRPYASLGFGGINYTYNIDKSYAIGDPAVEGEALWDVAFILGGGADLMMGKKWAVNASVDYRHTLSDGLDGASFGTSVDGYLTARGGIVLFMGKKESAPKEEDLLAGGEDLYSQVEEEPVDSDEETQAILRQLMGVEDEAPAEEETTTTDAPAGDEYTKLQERAEQLKASINDKERTISEMESEISSKEARINDLQNELQQVETYTGDFRSAYKEGLREYGSRNYDKSIAIYRNLYANNPSHTLASNCIYWIGESYFKKGDYLSAIESFQSVFDYDKSYKKDDATLMLGRCHHKLGQMEKAKSYFNQLISAYPNSEYVSKAQQWLKRIQ